MLSLGSFPQNAYQEKRVKYEIGGDKAPEHVKINRGKEDEIRNDDPGDQDRKRHEEAKEASLARSFPPVAPPAHAKIRYGDGRSLDAVVRLRGFLCRDDRAPRVHGRQAVRASNRVLARARPIRGRQEPRAHQLLALAVLGPELPSANSANASVAKKQKQRCPDDESSFYEQEEA